MIATISLFTSTSIPCRVAQTTSQALPNVASDRASFAPDRAPLTTAFAPGRASLRAPDPTLLPPLGAIDASVDAPLGAGRRLDRESGLRLGGGGQECGRGDGEGR